MHIIEEMVQMTTRKYTLWKKIYKEKKEGKKKAYELTEEKCPYIYRVAQKGAGQLAHTVAFLPSLGHPINMIFIRRLNRQRMKWMTPPPPLKQE